MHPEIERRRMLISRDEVLQLLHAHKLLGSVPENELAWLADNGVPVRMEDGDRIGKKGEIFRENPLGGLHVIFRGHLVHLVDNGGAWRKVMEWNAGDVTGLLPYSRMTTAPGNTIAEQAIESLLITPDLVATMPQAVPHVTTKLVHVMIDRARVFKLNDSQVEKMASLGKLAAGLAHELNNPASAAARSARLLTDALSEGDKASRGVGSAQFSEEELKAVQEVRTLCINTPATTVRTPLERADREEEIGEWLVGHGMSDEFAPALAETEVKIGALDAMARAVTAAKLEPALRWVAAGCTIRGLAKDIERAASRVHELVSAIKGFTYMDHAAAPEPFDVRKGLTDTLAVLGNKARSQAISVTVDVPDGLPRARGFGGELNQVWANLIDNALDAVGQGGMVRVTAKHEGTSIIVRVTDNGPGVPADLQRKIFDPFFTTKPVGKGTGLGLDIVRRLVESNDGRVELESAPGSTTFSVTLPVA